jgi:multidrug efflux pump subunit AcrA (membrane-fusion protein)
MNSSKLSGVLGWVVVMSLLTGCGILKKKQAEPTPSATVAVQTAAPTVTPPPVATAPAVVEPTVADESIAAPEDFEDEAFEKVSDKTYKAELDSLKKEIEAK